MQTVCVIFIRSAFEILLRHTATFNDAMSDVSFSIHGQGRTEIFRRVSRASRQSFRVPELSVAASTPPPTTSPITPKVVRRKASFEGVVKHLTDLAVTISADTNTNTNAPKESFSHGRHHDDAYTIQAKTVV